MKVHTRARFDKNSKRQEVRLKKAYFGTSSIVDLEEIVNVASVQPRET